MCHKIIFQDLEYPARHINMPGFGNVLISIISLNDRLLNKENDYVSVEALHVDELIFFFVDDECIYKSESEIVEVLSKQIL